MLFCKKKSDFSVLFGFFYPFNGFLWFFQSDFVSISICHVSFFPSVVFRRDNRVRFLFHLRMKLIEVFISHGGGQPKKKLATFTCVTWDKWVICFFFGGENAWHFSFLVVKFSSHHYRASTYDDERTFLYNPFGKCGMFRPRSVKGALKDWQGVNPNEKLWGFFFSRIIYHSFWCVKIHSHTRESIKTSHFERGPHDRQFTFSRSI